MTDTSAAETLRELGKQMGKAVQDLKQGLLKCEEYYKGPAGMAYQLVLVEPGHDEEVHFIYNNGATPDFQLNPPTVGGTLPSGTPANVRKYRIKSYEGFRQIAAKMALEELEKSKTASNDLDKLTQQDVEDLADLPEALADSVDMLTTISSKLNAGHSTLTDLQTEAAGATWWTSDARGKYDTTAGTQSTGFKESSDDAEKIIEGDIALAKQVTDLVRALRNIAQGRRDRAALVIDDILAVASGDWISMTRALTSSINKWEDGQHQDMNDGLTKLANSAQAQNTIARAKRTAVAEWPKAGVSSSGDGRPNKDAPGPDQTHPEVPGHEPYLLPY